jgi:hypothetical protein
MATNLEHQNSTTIMLVPLQSMPAVTHAAVKTSHLPLVWCTKVAAHSS